MDDALSRSTWIARVSDTIKFALRQRNLTPRYVFQTLADDIESICDRGELARGELKRLGFMCSKIPFSAYSFWWKVEREAYKWYLLIVRLEEIHIRTTSRISLRNTTLQSSRLIRRAGGNVLA